MKRLILVFTPLFCLFAPLLLGVSKEETTKNKMMADLTLIKNIFEDKYAPADWKKKYLHWDLDEQIALSQQQVLKKSAIETKDYQQILRQFFSSMKDYHTHVNFYSTELAVLPFRVQSVNGKYFFTWVFYLDETELEKGLDEELISFLNLPFKKGDELISFDHQPVDEVVQKIKGREFGHFNNETDQLLAEGLLTMRIGAKGDEVPEGPVTVVVKNSNTGNITSHTLQWIYIPEKIQNSFQAHIPKKKSHKRLLSQDPFFHKKMSIPLYDQLQQSSLLMGNRIFNKVPSLDNQDDEGQEEENEWQESLLGNKKGFLPHLGKVLWEGTSFLPFHAYVFETENEKIVGYIRIPTYMGSDYLASAFGKIIESFEEHTDALIIDQLNNPGGSYFYMSALASRLTTQPLLNPTHRMTLTQKEIMFAITSLEEFSEGNEQEIAEEYFGSQIHGYQVDGDFIYHIKKYFNSIISEWNEGRHFTNPLHLYGMEYLKPHSEVCYTKPILILINGLDFSCADFFPALLQDNNRALIFGSKTAGAGGYVMSHSYPNIFGVAEFSYTASIAERSNKKPIENLGVTPNIPYDLTERDLREGYVDYKEAIQQALKTLIPNP